MSALGKQNNKVICGSHLRCILIVLFFLLALSNANSQAINQAMLEVDAETVSVIEKLVTIRGLVNAMPVKPWSIAQALTILDSLENLQGLDSVLAGAFGWSLKLSRSERELIEALRADLNKAMLISEAGFDFETGLRFSPELYLKSRPNSAIDGNAWEYAYEERQPLIALDLYGSWGGDKNLSADFYGLWGGGVVDLREDHNTLKLDLSDGRPANISNFPEDTSYIDFQFPHRSLLATGGKNWLLAIGRDKLNFGNGKQGNLGISDFPDFYDFARLQLYSKPLSYTTLWLGLEPSYAGLESLMPGTTEELEALENAKNAFVHRIDLNFWDTLHIGITEAIMVGGEQPSLKYFNPFIIFHNLFPWLENPDTTIASSLAGLELTLTPIRGLSLWYQYYQNQVTSDFERQVYGDAADGVPDSFAQMAGFEFTWAIGAYEEEFVQAEILSAKGPFIFNLGLEWAMTNPWMYIRENALNSWFWRRRLASNVAGGDQFKDKILGWHLGPDSNSIYSWLELSRYNLGFVKLSFEYRQKGENTLYTPYETGPQAVSLLTPSGIPIETYLFGLTANIELFKPSKELSFLPALSIHTDLRYLYTINAQHQVGLNWDEWQWIIGLNLSWKVVSQ